MTGPAAPGTTQVTGTPQVPIVSATPAAPDTVYDGTVTVVASAAASVTEVSALASAVPSAA